MSVYVYVANNPIVFIDPDGKKIKGVVVQVDNQGNKTLDYSNASKATKKILSAMLKTESGTNAAIAFAEVETNITLKISKGISSDGATYGETEGSEELNNGGTYKYATIIFYEGDFDSDKMGGRGKFGDTDFSLEEFYNIGGVHEREHLTPEQIQIDRNFDGKTATEEQYKNYMLNVEGNPHKSEVKARKEYRAKFGGSDVWQETNKKNYIQVDDNQK